MKAPTVTLTIAVEFPASSSWVNPEKARQELAKGEWETMTKTERAEFLGEISPQGAAEAFLNYASGWCMTNDTTYRVVSAVMEQAK